MKKKNHASVGSKGSDFSPHHGPHGAGDGYHGGAHKKHKGGRRKGKHKGK